MVKFGNEATVQSGLLRFILTVQIDLDKQGNRMGRSATREQESRLVICAPVIYVRYNTKAEARAMAIRVCPSAMQETRK